jgi:Xaa-Pro dipeptidase
MNSELEFDPLFAEYREHLGSVMGRHDAALEACGFDGVVIHAGTLHPVFLDDQCYPFKLNPHFRLWIPDLADPESVIVYRPGEKPRLLHFRPVDFWHKVPEAPSDPWTEHFDIIPVADGREIRRHMGHDLSNTVFVGEPKARAQAWGIETCNPQPLIDRLDYARSLKTDYELSCLRRASRRAVLGHRAAEYAFRARSSALDIHLAYLKAVRHAEHELPYSSIVALNENCAVLHYQFVDKDPPDEGRWNSFLIDAGATYRGYAADITRSYAADDQDFQDLIDALNRAQLDLCDQVSHGVDFKDLQTQTHRKVADILSTTGVVRLDPEAVFEKGLTRTFFPHGLGHFLGLQVHDVGGFLVDPEGNRSPPPQSEPYLRLTRRLEPRQVLTIEPGVYFIDSLLERLRATPASRHVDWTMVDALIPFGGARVEDNVAVAESGHENLTRNAFAD